MSKLGPFPQIGFRQGGNPLLIEEEGKSYTIGARYVPQFLPGLALSIDYYDIEVTESDRAAKRAGDPQFLLRLALRHRQQPILRRNLPPQLRIVNSLPLLWSRAASTMLGR